MKNLILVQWLIVCVITGSASAGFADLILQNVNVSVVELLIPTLRAPSEACRNSSQLYLKELRKFKVWASDMFDATTKFPTGIFGGSNYDLGNYDECVQVQLPESFGFKGKYCLAKFELSNRNNITKTRLVENIDRYDQINNLTTWEKIELFSKRQDKAPRGLTHFAFCFPSSCTAEDLEYGIQETFKIISGIIKTDVHASVTQLDCHILEKYNFSNGDIAYMACVGVFVLFVIFCTLYHLITETTGMESYQMNDSNHSFLKGCSLSYNLRKLAKRASTEEGLECLHGLKVLSMFLTIMGHRIMFVAGNPIHNTAFTESMYQRFEYAFLLNGPIVVDTFFTISGFLACYLILLELEKKKGKINLILVYIHRFVRLTPAYLVVILFYMTIFSKLGSGPLYRERIEVERDRCLKSWWTNVMYINNYVNVDNICLFQSWYLTCDMQYFLLAPLFGVLLWKKPRFGILGASAIIVFSVVTSFISIFVNNYDGIMLLYMKFLRDPVKTDAFKYVYIPSHTRASPYFLGILAGYLKFKIRRSNFKITTSMATIGWLLYSVIMSTTIYSAILFYLPGRPVDNVFSALYGSMHHFTFSICICWIIISVSEGSGEWIKWILCWRPFALLSRITYGAYLSHAAFQMYTVATIRTPTNISIMSLTYLTAGDITLAYISGLLLCMVFQSPIFELEKRIFPNKPAEEKPKKTSGHDLFNPDKVTNEKFY